MSHDQATRPALEGAQRQSKVLVPLGYATFLAGTVLTVGATAFYPVSTTSSATTTRDVAMGAFMAVFSVARIMAPRTAVKTVLGIFVLGVLAVLSATVVGPEPSDLHAAYRLELVCGTVAVVASVLMAFGMVAGRRRRR